MLLKHKVLTPKNKSVSLHFKKTTHHCCLKFSPKYKEQVQDYFLDLKAKGVGLEARGAWSCETKKAEYLVGKNLAR